MNISEFGANRAIDSSQESALRQVHEIFNRQKAAFQAHPFPSAADRIKKLAALHQLIRDHVEAIQQAVDADFGHRCIEDTMLTEVMGSLTAVTYAKNRLKGWMKQQKRPVDVNFKPATARIIPQPKGVVGIMAPWNFPFGLVLKPLVAALSAGNRVMIKPSEFTPNITKLLKSMLGKLFDETEVAVLEGGEDIAQAFSELPFDHLLFTGSTSTGRRVMAAAAKNLTPLTLELGGKSPVIIADDYNMEKAVRSIITGKMLNAGQTCTAPDYVLVPKDRLDEFISCYQATINHMYPSPADNPDYTSIVNQRHFDRLQQYVSEAQLKNVRMVPLYAHDQTNSERRKLQPQLLINPDLNLRIMLDEVFGPLLSVFAYDRLPDAVSFINNRPRPLALYLFTNDRKTEAHVLASTISGGVTVNDTLLHYTQESLPFGGIGESGFGSYHGEAGFKTFSHLKPVFRQSRINFLNILRAPYSGFSRWLIMKIIKLA